jgi:hypothetical protein
MVVRVDITVHIRGVTDLPAVWKCLRVVGSISAV